MSAFRPVDPANYTETAAEMQAWPRYVRAAFLDMDPDFARWLDANDNGPEPPHPGSGAALRPEPNPEPEPVPVPVPGVYDPDQVRRHGHAA
jgi:hypothetical protein